MTWIPTLTCHHNYCINGPKMIIIDHVVSLLYIRQMWLIFKYFPIYEMWWPLVHLCLPQESTQCFVYKQLYSNLIRSTLLLVSVWLKQFRKIEKRKHKINKDLVKYVILFCILLSQSFIGPKKKKIKELILA